jgi:hypothetical protein
MCFACRNHDAALVRNCGLGVVVKISRIENQAFFGFDNAAVMVGSSLIYAQDFSAAFTSAPFDPATELLQEEIASRLWRQNIDGEYKFNFFFEPTFVADIKLDVIPFNIIHPYNYFHFLIESLPSLLRLIQNGLVLKPSMVVTGLLHPNMQSALNLVIRNVFASVLQLNVQQYITCNSVVSTADSVYVAERIDGTLSSSTYNTVNIVALREFFKPYWSHGLKKSLRKIFIDRQSVTRKLENTGTLAGIAQAVGYEVVDPGMLNFQDQVDLFSSASHICGPTGAWAANLLFVPEGAKVTILSPESIQAPSLWVGLGNAVGIDVRDVFCPITKLHVRQPIHSDFMLAEDRFRALL